MDLTIPYIILALISPIFFFYYLMRSIYETVRQAKRDEEQNIPDPAFKFTGTMKITCFWLFLFLVTSYLTITIILVESL